MQHNYLSPWSQSGRVAELMPQARYLTDNAAPPDRVERFCLGNCTTDRRTREGHSVTSE